MTKWKTVAYTALAFLTLQLGAATKESDVTTGNCESELEHLKSCIATGEPCLDQVVRLVDCLDGNGLAEVKGQRMSLSVATDPGSPEWRMTLARPKRRDGDDSTNTAYYRIGKCYANPLGDHDGKGVARALVVIQNKDDPRFDQRYHGFANPRCDGHVSVGTVTDTRYFSSAVRSYIDTGVRRPNITSLSVPTGQLDE